MEVEKLIAWTNDQIKAKITSLSFQECGELCDAMDRIISILGKEK